MRRDFESVISAGEVDRPVRLAEKNPGRAPGFQRFLQSRPGWSYAGSPHV